MHIPFAHDLLRLRAARAPRPTRLELEAQLARLEEAQVDMQNMIDTLFEGLDAQGARLDALTAPQRQAKASEHEDAERIHLFTLRERARRRADDGTPGIDEMADAATLAPEEIARLSEHGVDRAASLERIRQRRAHDQAADAQRLERARADPELVGFYGPCAPTIDERARMSWAGFTTLPPASQALARKTGGAGPGRAGRGDAR